jgi:RNA polymerase sigma-70 factor (ECF subfamily)
LELFFGEVIYSGVRAPGGEMKTAKAESLPPEPGPRTTTALMVEAFLELRRRPGELTEQHFWHLVQRFRAELVNQAFAVLGNEEDAEDVAQETLCQAFENIGTLEDPRKISHWLRKINRHNALYLNGKRKKERGRKSGEDVAALASTETTPTGQLKETVRKTTEAEQVARAMETLPEIFRVVVAMRYWEKSSYEEISDRLGLPVGTVRSRLARANLQLAETLRRQQKDQP